MGVLFVYQTSQPIGSTWYSISINFGVPYLAIAVSLNVLLTLMIIVRLFLHSRNIRATMGTPGGIGGFYKAIITMLIESCALYTVNSLLVIGLSNSGIADVFLPVLTETQVRAFRDLWAGRVM